MMTNPWLGSHHPLWDNQDLAALNLRPAARWPLLEKLTVHISIFQGLIPWRPLLFPKTPFPISWSAHNSTQSQRSLGGVKVISGCNTLCKVQHEVNRQLTLLLLMPYVLTSGTLQSNFLWRVQRGLSQMTLTQIGERRSQDQVRRCERRGIWSKPCDWFLSVTEILCTVFPFESHKGERQWQHGT